MGGQKCDFFLGGTFVEVTRFLNILRTEALAIATLFRAFQLVVGVHARLAYSTCFIQGARKTEAKTLNSPPP